MPPATTRTKATAAVGTRTFHIRPVVTEAETATAATPIVTAVPQGLSDPRSVVPAIVKTIGYQQSANIPADRTITFSTLEFGTSRAAFAPIAEPATLTE